MMDLYAKYSELKEKRRESELYEVEDFIAGSPHKLGVTEDGYPVIFVECSDEVVSPQIKLKTLNVNFSQLCTLRNESGEALSKKFSIIVLTSLEMDLQNYFLEVFAIVMKRFVGVPSVAMLRKEILKVVDIFMTPPPFSTEKVQGLWAELFVIANASDPETLARAWHVSVEDKYDFNDGKDKIEVKSTNKPDPRVHSFALEQLNPNAGSELAIASVITVRSGEGMSIFDLTDVIGQRGVSIELMSKIQEVVYLTIGPHIKEAEKVTFDFTLAVNTYRKYDHRDVPAISRKDVPTGVTSVHFASDLEEVAPMDTSCVRSELIKAM